jgi:uncharacterized protein
MFFDPMYLLIIAPALLLGFWAQWRVKSAYNEANEVGASISGAEAARRILTSAGIHDVTIEQTPGFLSDHYDSHAKALRLSPDVYNNRTLAAVGIAAHESGHAIQDAHAYTPLVVRNAAVPAAQFGSSFSFILIFVGLVFSKALGFLLLLGIALFSLVVFFQLVNLPVEFNASSRAKAELINHGIVSQQEMTYVNRVLNAAAMTYVAATLQSVLTLTYYLMRYAGNRN